MANKIIIKKSSVAAKIPLANDLEVGEIAGNLEDQKLYSKKPDGTVVLMGSGLGGSGDVQGPASATNGAVALFDGTTGKLIKNGQVPGSIYTQNANNVNVTGGSISGITDLAISDGGTGASTASGARTNLGLGTAATTEATDYATAAQGDLADTALQPADVGTIASQNSNNVSITGGSITGITEIAVADGGTGASTASAALSNLGAYPASNPDGFTSNTGTVTSVSGTGTVNGISLSGTVNTSGNITLGGALSGVSLTTQVTGTLPIANGGTNATTAAGARTSLGLGTAATTDATEYATAAQGDLADTALQPADVGTIASQDSNNVNITGGAISGITDLAVVDGGTGSSTSSGARTNLGLGSIATQNANSVNIDGGAIDGTPVGANTASTGAFTNLSYTGTLTGGTGVINIGSGQVFKGTNGDFGIGTNLPLTKLDVRGGMNVGDGTTTIRQISAGGVGNFGTSTDHPLALRTNNTERLRIDTSGNLLVNSRGSANVPVIRFGGDASSGLFSPDPGFFAFSASSIERMRITNAGNVGIGTSAPAVKLEVARGSEGEYLRVGGDDAANARALRFTSSSSGGSAGAIHTINASSVAGILAFATANTERARFDTNGNFLFGATSSSNIGIPSLEVGGSNGNGLITVRRNTTTQAGHILFFNPNGPVGSITTNGSATAFNTSSDVRLKENIVDAPSSSNGIDAIQVRSFNWKVDGSHQKYGMIAQELETVAPHAVTKGEKEDDMWGVDYSKLVPMMLKEIQSLRARVAQLEGN